MKESYEKGLANRPVPTTTLAIVMWRVWHALGDGYLQARYSAPQ
jgi:hypothetical protein